MFQTQSVTGHRQPLPSSTKDSQKYCQSSETSILELVSGAVARPVTVSNFHTPSGFPKRHVATTVTLHSGRNSRLRSPQGTAPALATLPGNLTQSPPNIPPPRLPPSLEGTAQPKITGHISTFICVPEQAQTLQQQLLDHSEAQIEF